MAWFKDQWVLNLDAVWLVSSDGTTWAENPNRSPTSELSSATLTAGSDTLLAEVWNGLWYSENGIDWSELPESWETRRGPSEAAYSASFGYVATPWSDPGLYVSADGRDWQYAGYWPDVGDLTASGDRIFGGGYIFIFSGNLEFPDSSVVVELPDRGEVLLDQGNDFVANVAVGDKFTVSLPGYPPAGSGWEISEGPELCRLVDSPSFEQEEGGAEWEGTYRFTFEALQVGSEELLFEYSSPYDNGADVYTLVVDIHASDDE